MIKLAIRHKIYERCIDMFFDSLRRNFPIARHVPVVGERYSKIIDIESGETFYDCIIIAVENLSYYEDILEDYRDDDAEDELNDILFGIRYKMYMDEEFDQLEQYDEYQDTHVTKFDIDYIKCIK